MRIPLQELGFKESTYERPNQAWVCGWAKDGDPCKHGPDGNGRCTAHAQAICQPRGDGDRWLCTRADAFGGSCTEGPRPDGSCSCPTPEHLVCQPTRSLRAKRGLLVKLVAAATFGFLVLMLGDPWRQGFVSPGELSSVHLAIEGTAGEENCMTCHSAGSQGPAAWIETLLTASDDGEDHHNRSEQCLACHFKDGEIAREQAMLVHGVASGQLERVTLIAQSPNPDQSPEKPSGGIQANVDVTVVGASVIGATTSQLILADLVHGPIEDKLEIACSNCHQEHRGINHDLRLMDDVACQVCHQQSFESFNFGHPRFTQVPRQTGGISFDHAKHEERFESGKMNCAGCHALDSQGHTMEVKSFENACEGCHEQRSTDHHGDAIKKNPLLMIQLPEIEFEDDAYWPVDYAYGESLTPMMTMLLAGDDEALPLLEKIYDEDGAAGDLYEWLIETDDNDEPALRVELAMALKRLIAELADDSKDGAKARIDRLASALGTTVDDMHVQHLANDLASANFVMLIFKQLYLPQVDADLAGEEVSAEDDDQPETQWMTSATTAGWRVDFDDASVSYRPLTHGDSLLKDWMEALKIHSTKPAVDVANRKSEIRAALQKHIYAELKSDFNACTKCHTQEEQTINWNAAGRASGFSGYTKFNHSPHIAMLPDQDDCMTCHVLNTGSANDLSMPRGFLPHRNERCASCHAPGKANNTCLNCHQYHKLRP